MNIFGTLKLIAKIGFFDFLVDDEMVKNPFFTILESPKNTKNHISSTAGKLLNQAVFFLPLHRGLFSSRTSTARLCKPLFAPAAFEIVVHFFLDFLSFLNLALLCFDFFLGCKFFSKSFDLAKHSPLTICFWDRNSLRPHPHTFCGLRHPVHITAPVPGASDLGH